MRKVLLTYDVSNRQPEVKNAMKDKEYSEEKYGPSSRKIYKLPNTTLWKEAEELTTGTVIKDLQDVIAVLNKGVATKDIILLQKAMAVEFSRWNAIEN